MKVFLIWLVLTILSYLTFDSDGYDVMLVLGLIILSGWAFKLMFHDDGGLDHYDYN
jgi:hypothetical protein